MIVIIVIFYCFVWCYEDWVYRWIFLDVGYLLGNVELVFSFSNYWLYLIGGFNDEVIN